MLLLGGGSAQPSFEWGSSQLFSAAANAALAVACVDGCVADDGGLP